MGLLKLTSKRSILPDITCCENIDRDKEIHQNVGLTK